MSAKTGAQLAIGYSCTRTAYIATLVTIVADEYQRICGGIIGNLEPKLGQRRGRSSLDFENGSATHDESGERREENGDTLHVRRPPV
jgi:hypothetical protein